MMNSPVGTPAVSESTNRSQGSQGRFLYIDNVRWTMILLVISMHAADTYSPFGSWYFTDRRPMPVTTVMMFGIWQMYLQAFFMGLLFFIAGYFVPASFDRKGAVGFLRDRVVRLGVPVLLYMFCVGPVTEYYVAHSWTSTDPTSFGNEWVKHIRNGQFLQENGPLWFCLALLFFSAGYVLIRRLGLNRIAGRWGSKAPTTLGLVGFALTMAALTFIVRAVHAPSVLNLHLGDFTQYVLLFSAGVAAGRHKWLGQLRFARGLRWLILCVPSGLFVLLSLLVTQILMHGNGGALSDGWHWQNGAFALWESFTCVALSFGLLVVYREKFDKQGPLTRFLSANAFSVYVFHPPFVILIARGLHDMNLHPLLAFIILWTLSAAATFVLSAVIFRRIPLLQKVL